MQKNRGRIENEGSLIRDKLETAQIMLFEASLDLEEVALRIHQAIKRSLLVKDLLDPALERLDQICKDMKLAREEINKAWIEGQSRRWKSQ